MRLAAAALLALSAAAGAAAQTGGATAAGGDFTFRSVTPPPAGARKRIVFQNQSVVALRPGAAQGFWSRPEARPQVTRARPLAPALAAAADWGRATGRAAERDRETARRIMDAHGSAMLAAARGSGLSLSLLLAVAIAESGGDSRATSPKGALGLMQLMPATAAELGVSDAFAPAQAVPGAARHLAALLRRFDEDPLAALAAYNAGAAAVEARRGVPDWAETRAYVPRVLAAAAALQELCLSPPESFRAPCAPSPALHRPTVAATAARAARPGWIAAPR
ncbi:lytic transglycosylase domain-containing protein [Albimonas pacifica]|uniref:lytic transglycosylase domain-containing protein n=1 Tax=Albimonas pacifica TaxID=1114924 RepID=UPI001FE548BE|nr:lytic transglycosylase domain-containing protein [Albimonas pacifica]